MGKASRLKRERKLTSFKAPTAEREKRLADSQKPTDYDRLSPDQWLWCLHCEKFFQKKNLRQDDVGLRQGCAFYGECGGAGFDVDIFVWDSWAVKNNL